jgi:hypothetical protein
MRTAAVLICAGVALVFAAAAAAGDGGSGTYIVTGQTYDFNLLNTGTTSWQYFELAGPAGTTFVGGATIGEITAHCVAGQPDGVDSEILCGPISAAGLAPGTRVGFVATLSSMPACGAAFQLDVSSTGIAPYTPAAPVLTTASCASTPPAAATAPPSVHGTPVVGSRLVATPPAWNATPTQVSYRWQLCTTSRCVAIAGQTKLSLLLSAKDAGHAVRLVATASFATGASTSISKKIEVRARS